MDLSSLKTLGAKSDRQTRFKQLATAKVIKVEKE
jgi:hypothetical protein